jgi:hypothetical protein
MTAEERALDVTTGWSIDPDVIYPRVVEAIRAAVAEERERCAKVADRWADQDYFAEGIAALIRAGNGDAPPGGGASGAGGPAGG